ncbi:hypothetical protein HUG17_2569 [Dermatophagoides farinae]|uniref:Uncharacterized protein n=1 Tax=Dermatophagoides farinae TaxID=6954 RepID=A0A9D4NUI4_DERFA|nr:hypothetical protein HUG17_2569 [Dermatophagoides farinae]
MVATIGYAAYIKSQSGINEQSLTENELKKLDHNIHQKMPFFPFFENISICVDCPSDNWFLEECQFRPHQSPYESILRLYINAVKIDKEYEIIRADPFYLLVNDHLNKSNFCISRYTGSKYAIINKRTKCARNIIFEPINDHQAPFIFHSVNCKNETNSVEAKWKTVECKAKELITPEEIVQNSTTNYLFDVFPYENLLNMEKQIS